MDVKEFCELCDFRDDFYVCETPEPRERYAKREWCGWSRIEGVGVTTEADYIKVNKVRISRHDKLALKNAIDNAKNGDENLAFKPIISPINIAMYNNIEKLVELIRKKDEINTEIIKIIGLPMLLEYIDEYIASLIFKIQMKNSPSKYGLYGYFTEGLNCAKTVNIKWYTERPNIIENNPDCLPDFHLVIIGTSSKDFSMNDKPWVIKEIFLFNAQDQMKKIKQKNNMAKNIASFNVSKEYKKKNQLYPSPYKKQRLPEIQENPLRRFFSESSE